jgi:hypothetical protein
LLQRNPTDLIPQLHQKVPRWTTFKKIRDLQLTSWQQQSKNKQIRVTYHHPLHQWHHSFL